jgi:hypothetical protein
MLAVIKGLHDGARGRVRVEGQMSEWFNLKMGLRQGAVFSPTLFNIFFGEIIRQMKMEFQTAGLQGARIQFRRTGVAVNGGGRFRTNDRDIERATIFEVLFADDLVLYAASEAELQQMLDIFHRLVTKFGQEVSITKTKVLIVQRRGAMGESQFTPQTFFVGDQPIQIVDSFKYLGGLDTNDAKMTKEINVRIQRMKGVYAKYDKDIFQSNLATTRKVDLFNMIVVINGLFGCQVWNVTQAQVEELEAVHFSLLRKMLRLRTGEYSRGEVIQYCMHNNWKVLPIEWRMTKLQLRYLGHEVRVDPDRVPTLPHNMLFRGHLDEFPRLQGRMEQAYPATIKRALEVVCGLQGTRWVELAKDKKKWKKFVDSEAVNIFMQGWEDKEQLKKELRHTYAQNREQREVFVEDGLDDKGSDEEEELSISHGEHRTVEWGSRIRESVDRVNAHAASVFIADFLREDQLTRNVRFSRRKQERKKRKRNQDVVVYE